MATTFRITTAEGREFEGAVQGCGGQVEGAEAGLRRLQRATVRAASGRRIVDLFEPAPGCVEVATAGGFVSVPLSGAAVVVVEASL